MLMVAKFMRALLLVSSSIYNSRDHRYQIVGRHRPRKLLVTRQPNRIRGIANYCQSLIPNFAYAARGEAHESGLLCSSLPDSMHMLLCPRA